MKNMIMTLIGNLNNECKNVVNFASELVELFFFARS